MGIKNAMKFNKLSWKQITLLIVTFFLTGFFRFLILFLPFKVIAGFMGEEGLETAHILPNKHLSRVLFIRWVVHIVSIRTPWKSACMVQALTAQLLLRLFTIPATLYLGVGKSNDKLVAHAWLRSGSEIVTGEEAMNDFHPIIFYGSSSKRLWL